MPYDNWEVEDAARTLMRAEEIKQNKDLYDKAQGELKKQANAANAALNKSKQETDKQKVNTKNQSQEVKTVWSPSKHLGRIGEKKNG